MDDSVSVSSALQWLKIIDNGNYAKSWDEAAELFRNSVTKDQWAQSVSSVRGSIGKLVNRNMKSKKYSTSLPGVPDGEYFIFEFDSSFEKKKESVETLTLMKEGEYWKVIGYFIR